VQSGEICATYKHAIFVSNLEKAAEMYKIFVTAYGTEFPC
jgi:hypothetical protein